MALVVDFRRGSWFFCLLISRLATLAKFAGLSSRNRAPCRGARREAARIAAGDVGISLAGKLRSDFGRNRCRDRHSFLFFAAVQNSDRLNATDAKRNHRASDDS